MDKNIKTIHFPAGATVLVENSINEGFFYILKSGSIIIQSDIQFYDNTLNKYQSGDTFGLVSGLTKNPTRFTLIAEADCDVARIPIENLGKYFHDNINICLKIISLYSNQLRALNNYLVAKHPRQKDSENPLKLLDAGQEYANLKQYNIASHCLLKYIKWVKDKKPHLRSIELAEKLLNDISTDFKLPEYKTKILSVKKNDVIFVENEPADYFYVIESGAVKISKLVDKHEFILCILREGEIFGEMAILNKKVRNASAIIFEDSKLLRLSIETFMDTIGEQLITNIFESFARRIWYARQRVSLIEMNEPVAMMYAYLQILISDLNAKTKNRDKTQKEYVFTFSLTDLKKMIGFADLKDETINEFLSDVNIDISNHLIRVHDPRKIDDKVALFKNRHKKNLTPDMPV